MLEASARRNLPSWFAVVLAAAGDGQEPLDDSSGGAITPPGALASLGTQHFGKYQNTGTFLAYIDEVAFDGERIGCNN
jgi:hypothetical protein